VGAKVEAWRTWRSSAAREFRSGKQLVFRSNLDEMGEIWMKFLDDLGKIMWFLNELKTIENWCS
jgi:hypothetical protein